MIATAYSYVRFSSKKQSKGSSLERQTTDTVAGESPESWCKRQPFEVVLDTKLSYRDLGRSGWKGDKQKELMAFLQAIKEKKVLPGSYLLVERVDRITRQGINEGMDIFKQIFNGGVSVVILSNGRVYGPNTHKSLKDGAMELQFFLEMAKEYSDGISARVKASWGIRFKKARENGFVITKNIPPWLRVVGDGKERKFEVIDEKVELLKTIYALALGGKGVYTITKKLIDEDVPPMVWRAGGYGKHWSAATVRRILMDRSVLGEYTPVHNGVRMEPVVGYFPAVIEPGVFYKVQGGMCKRKRCNVARTSRIDNLFSGLITDARVDPKGKVYSYVARMRMDHGRPSTSLQSANISLGAAGFPYFVFREAILHFLREVKVSDLCEVGNVDEAFVLQQELEVNKKRYAEWSRLDAEGKVSVEVVHDAQSRLLERRKELERLIVEAEARSYTPLVSGLEECKSLVDAVEGKEKHGRLKMILRRIVDRIWLFVIPQVRKRIAWVQVDFAGGGKRLWFIRYCPPPTNGQDCGVDGYWMAGAGVLGEDEHKFNLETAACQEVLMEVTKTWRDPRGSERFETALKEGRAICRVIRCGNSLG